MPKFVLILFLFVSAYSSAQEKNGLSSFSVEANYFYGNILEHSPDISHLITAHPRGFMLNYDRKTFGEKLWQRHYNYPDVGFSFLYQNMGNPDMGDNYGFFAHLGFYFFKRKLSLRIGTGIAYNTNPYDRDTNFRNNVYGSHLMNNSLLMLNYRQKLFKNLGLQAGITLVHYSNGNSKAPNTSTNTFAFNLGLNYSFNTENLPEYIPLQKEAYSEPIHYNFVFRSGIHSSDVINSGEKPFYIFSAYADKRISYKSTLLAGAELFFSEMLEEYIYYRSVAYPEEPVSGDEDSKRVGVFAGYQLNVGEISAYVNLGYYIYYPFDFEGRVYNRLGLNYKITEDWFVGASVKSHAAKAEAAEFSVGYRL